MDESDSLSPTLHTPSPWSRTLVEVLLPFATIKTYRKGIHLALEENGKPVCRMLITGSAQTYRNTDHLLVASIPSLSILGFGGQNSVYIVTAESCKIATMPLDEFYRHIQEQEMWEVLAKHMIMVSNKLFYYSKLMSSPTAYETIRNQLMELNHEPEEIRKTVSVERYIRDRTHLSRSSIMKILAELKKGNYIDIEDGKLLEIHHLPLKY